MLRDFEHGHICMSENGWTNDDIGYEWFTRLFGPSDTA